jgi:hypothetical protein
VAAGEILRGGPHPRVARWYIFIPKNPDLGIFWSSLERKVFVSFMAIWNILWMFGIFYGHLVSLWSVGTHISAPFWYIAPRQIWQPCPIRRRCQKTKPRWLPHSVNLADPWHPRKDPFSKLFPGGYLMGTYVLRFFVAKQLDYLIESTKWVVRKSLSQWMYFACGACLLGLPDTKGTVSYIQKVTLGMYTWSTRHRNF